jgi:hypothetical protein
MSKSGGRLKEATFNVEKKTVFPCHLEIPMQYPFVLLVNFRTCKAPGSEK